MHELYWMMICLSFFLAWSGIFDGQPVLKPIFARLFARKEREEKA